MTDFTQELMARDNCDALHIDFRCHTSSSSDNHIHQHREPKFRMSSIFIHCSVVRAGAGFINFIWGNE